MNRYKAKWIFGKQCLKAGQVKAECEADTRAEFAEKLQFEYANNLGDGFSSNIYTSLDDFKNVFGEDSYDWPEWAKDANLTKCEVWPIIDFVSNSSTTRLYQARPYTIIKQIAGENYGDYDLKMKGIRV